MHAFLSCPNRHLPIPVKAVGDWFRRRRIALCLSCARAAAASGLDLSEWKALELGLVPTANENLLRSIACTLELSYDEVACAIAPLEVHFESTLG